MEEWVNKKIIGFAIKVALIVLAVFMSFFVGIVVYIHMNPFQISYEEELAKDYIARHSYGDIFFVKNENIGIHLPNNVISSEIKKRILIANKEAKLGIGNVEVDPENTLLRMNGKLGKLNIPMNLNYTVEYTDTEVRINFDKITFTNKNLICPKVIRKYLDKRSDIILNGMSIMKADILNNDLLEFGKIIYDNERWTTYLKVNEDRLLGNLEYIEENMNLEVRDQYKGSDNDLEVDALFFVEKGKGLSHVEVNRLLEDILGEEKLLKALLVLGKTDIIEELFANYGKYFEKVTLEEVLLEKEERVEEIIGMYSADIFKAVDIYFNHEDMYISNSRPYSFDHQKTILIKNIVDFYKINISEDVLLDFDFYYSWEESQLYVTYKSEKDKYLLVDKEGMQSEKRSNMLLAHYGEESKTVRNMADYDEYAPIEKIILEDLQTAGIFVRYIKTDGQYVFAVVSSVDDYQRAIAYGLELKDSQWVILDKEIESIKNFNKENKDFNLDLVLYEIESEKLTILTNKVIQVIEQDLLGKDVIDRNEDTEIVYCSYANNYIAIRLANHMEYVYRVFNLRLYDVRSKNEAVQTWSDIPDIILLEEIDGK